MQCDPSPFQWTKAWDQENDLKVDRFPIYKFLGLKAYYCLFFVYLVRVCVFTQIKASNFLHSLIKT